MSWFTACLFAVSCTDITSPRMGEECDVNHGGNAFVASAPISLGGLFRFDPILEMEDARDGTSNEDARVERRVIGGETVTITSTRLNGAVVPGSVGQWIDADAVRSIIADASDSRERVRTTDFSLSLEIDLESSTLSYTWDHLPPEEVGDIGFVEHIDHRDVWGISRDADDDGMSFILNGLPQPQDGALTLRYGAPFDNSYASLEIGVKGGGELIITEHQSGHLIHIHAGAR